MSQIQVIIPEDDDFLWYMNDYCKHVILKYWEGKYIVQNNKV